MKTPTPFVLIGLAIAVVFAGIFFDWPLILWAGIAVLLFAASGFVVSRGAKPEHDGHRSPAPK